VGRVAVNVLEESRVGAIVTQGDPSSNGASRTLGADFNYRSSRLFGDRILLGSAWALDTDADDRGDRAAAFGARVEYPNDRFNWKLGARELQEDFRPALGFVNRVGIREYESTFRYRVRSVEPRAPLRFADFGWDARLVTDVDNRLETSELALRLLDVANQQEDKLTLRWIASEERLSQPFLIFPGVYVPPGRYPFNRAELTLTSDEIHPISGKLLVSWGGFYSGRRLETDARLVWRPSGHYQLELDYIQHDVRLPDDPGFSVDDFTARVVRARVLVNFSVDVSWDTVVQYDNASDSVGVNSRLRWIVEPGNEVFLVLNHGADVDRAGSNLRAAYSEAVAKVEWTYRF
jgi:hypothetical protein